MGDDEHGHAIGGQFQHHVEDLTDDLRIQGRGDLVEQQQLWVHHQRSHDRDPLLLTSRQLARQRARLLGEPDTLQQLRGLFHGPVTFAPLHQTRAEQQVVHHVQVREQLVALEHHPDSLPDLGPARPRIRDHDTVQFHGAVRDRLQAVEATQQRRLPAARGADDGNHLAGGDLQVDSVQGPEIPVVLSQTGDSQHRGHVVAHFLSRRRAPHEIGKHTTKYMISTVP